MSASLAAEIIDPTLDGFETAHKQKAAEHNKSARTHGEQARIQLKQAELLALGRL